MIKELRLENWKSFEQATLYLDPLTVLIGANASGKSNVLDALLLLNRLASGLSLTAAIQGDANIPSIRGGLEWACQKPKRAFAIEVLCESQQEDRTDYLYRLEVVISETQCEVVSEKLTRIKYRHNTDKNPFEIKLFWTLPCNPEDPYITTKIYNEKSGTPRSSSRVQAILSQLYHQKNRNEVMTGIAETITALQSIFILDPIPSHMRQYSVLAKKLDRDAANIAGVIAALPDDEKNKIETILTDYAKHLPERELRRIYAETVGKFKTDAMLYCEEHWRETTLIDARSMSDGTLRFLAVLTALLTLPEYSLLVVEEIDNGLHPSRSNLLIKMLKEESKKRHIDILMTTHNPSLLNDLGPEMVPFIVVSHRDMYTGFSRLTLLEDIEHLPKLLAQGPVGNLVWKGKIQQSIQVETTNDK